MKHHTTILASSALLCMLVACGGTETGQPDDHGAAGLANVVRFHTEFPGPGKYKVWAQFDVGGKVLVADFVVDVAGDAAAAPADPHAAHRH